MITVPFYLAAASMLQASLTLPMPHGVRCAIFGAVTGVNALSGAHWMATRLSDQFFDQLGLLFPT